MKMPTNIAFPGLGIEQFTVDKVAFSVGKIDIRWYAIMITLGMCLAFLYTGLRAKHENMVFDDVIDFGLFAVILGVIGARAYYVLTTCHLRWYHRWMHRHSACLLFQEKKLETRL